MTRWLCPLVGAALAVPAAAHHLWILPDERDGSKATAVFSDTLAPASPDSLRKVAHTKLYVREPSGNEELVEWTRGEAAFTLSVPGKGRRTVGGSCTYGVETFDHRKHEHGPPYLLVYYPKVDLAGGAGPKPWDRLPLEIMAEVTGNRARLQVLFRGKPVPKAELYVLTDGPDRKALETDDQGRATFTADRAGAYGFRSRTIEAKEGTHNGKKYGEVRHYASLVIPLVAEPAGGKK